MTHMTQIEARLADSPDDTARDINETLDAARASLERALRTPLTPDRHAEIQTLMRAIEAAGAILGSLSRRYGTSYGQSS